MREYQLRTGERMTYQRLSDKTGLNRGTLETIGRNPHHNTTLERADAICKALNIEFTELLERRPDRPPKKKKRKRERREG